MEVIFSFKQRLSVTFATFLMVCISLPNLLSAEVQNPKNIFENVAVCDAYSNFLMMGDGNETEECHAIAKFVISNSDLGPSRFLKTLFEKVGENSALGAVAQTMF